MLLEQMVVTHYNTAYPYSLKMNPNGSRSINTARCHIPIHHDEQPSKMKQCDKRSGDRVLGTWRRSTILRYLLFSASHNLPHQRSHKCTYGMGCDCSLLKTGQTDQLSRQESEDKQRSAPPRPAPLRHIPRDRTSWSSRNEYRRIDDST